MIRALLAALLLAVVPAAIDPDEPPNQTITTFVAERAGDVVTGDPAAEDVLDGRALSFGIPRRALHWASDLPDIGALAQDEDPVGELLYQTVMRGCHHGDPGTAQLGEQTEDRPGILGVQSPRGLISQEHLSATHQSPGDPHALLLPTG